MAIALSGFTFSGIFPTALALTGFLFPDVEGSALGILSTMGSLGSVVLFWLTGYVADLIDMDSGFMVMILACFSALVLFQIYQVPCADGRLCHSNRKPAPKRRPLKSYSERKKATSINSAMRLLIDCPIFDVQFMDSKNSIGSLRCRFSRRGNVAPQSDFLTSLSILNIHRTITIEN